MSNRFQLNKKLFALVVFLLLALVVFPVQAKIFKWKDENGKTHFTDNPAKIPAKYREGNKVKTMKGVTEGGSSSGGDEVGDELSSAPRSYSGKSKKHVIKLKPAGSGNFIAETILNGKVRANLMVDTGASLIVISERVAKQLNMRNLNGRPQVQSTTAGGVVQSPLITFKKVQVGSAVIHDVEASVNSHMGMLDGLLGMTFLGEFRVEMQGGNNQMILKPLGKPGDRRWGGQTAEWWKKKFDEYTNNIRQYRRMKPYAKGKPRQAKNIDKLIKYYERLHKSLDQRAKLASVPEQFRSYP